MILVTVGTQLGFPRLVEAMEDWAATVEERVLAQVGPEKGHWPHLEVHAALAPAEFDAAFAKARAVVGHAGIGTILSARQHRRPLVILPRRHALGEHRNDHQMATARAVEQLPGIHVVWEAKDIPHLLAKELAPANETPSDSLEALVMRLRTFIEEAG